MAEKFEHVDLTGATFDMVGLANTRFHNVDMRGAQIRGAQLNDADIDGDITNLTVNGVKVEPLIEAELDRLHPERTKLRPTDPAGFSEAWTIIERLWADTVDRARKLDPALLHERVDGEWSFIQTLRHLVYATDTWILRTLLGDPSPWHPLGLPHDELPDTPGVPRDYDARPTLDEVLTLRAGRMATVRQVITDLTDERLAGMTDPVPSPGYPPSDSYPVRRTLTTILNEEWWHRQFAERDLKALTG